MTYHEAKLKALTIPWKVKTCSEGEDCWCRVILPINPILYDNSREELYIVGSGALDKEFAEYFVELHNELLTKTKKSKFNKLDSIELNNLSNLKNPE